MKKQTLIELLANGREIEFSYQGKDYSLTQGTIKGTKVISFCEFYKETTEVHTPDEVLNITRNGISVLDMWESLSEDDVWIF